MYAPPLLQLLTMLGGGAPSSPPPSPLRMSVLEALAAAPTKKRPKPKPAPEQGPVVPLPGWPVREGLDRPTIWQGKPPQSMTPLELMLQRRA